MKTGTREKKLADIRSLGSLAMHFTWIVDGKPIKGSVEITASLSPTEKSTALAGESKLKEYSCAPVWTFHSLTVWSALPVMRRIESPACNRKKEKNYNRSH